MRQAGWMVGIATLALSGAAGARPSNDVPAPLRAHDAGRRIVVEAGQTVRFALPAMLGTGSYWRPRPDDAYVVISAPEVAADPQRPRCDATLLSIRFVKAGTATVEVAAAPMGHGGGNTSNVLKYRFVVLDGGSAS